MVFSVKLTGCCIIVLLQCVFQCQADRLLHYCVATMYFSGQADRLLYYCVAAMCVSVSS